MYYVGTVNSDLPRPDLPQTLIYSGQFLPLIGLNMHVVNKQTPIYRKPRSTADVSFSLKPAVNRGFTVI